MAKRDKRGVNQASILLGDEAELNHKRGDQSNNQNSFWAGLGQGERIAAIAVCLLLVVGALGAGFGDQVTSLFGSKDSNSSGQSSVNNGSSLSTLNPPAPLPPPSSTPQLSKEYIYAGSRMLAVEDANASAAPPADLAVWRPSTGYWHVLGGQGSAATNVQWGISTDKPVPGDFDGDGKTDFSVYRPSTGYWYVSNSSNGYTIELFFGSSGDQTAQADYDGDGKTDRAVFRNQSPLGWWHISRSTDSGTTSYQFGLGDDKPAPADYDGDGKADYAVWRGSNLTFYVQRSSDGQILAQTLGQTSGDIPVSADYDGDGKADFAVKSGNIWYIKQSSNGATQNITWEQATDKEVQNDYDGDGKVDIAVWQATYGFWKIRQSSKIGQANELRTEQWGGTFNGVPDIPVPAFYRR